MYYVHISKIVTLNETNFVFFKNNNIIVSLKIGISL